MINNDQVRPEYKTNKSAFPSLAAVLRYLAQLGMLLSCGITAALTLAAEAQPLAAWDIGVPESLQATAYRLWQGLAPGAASESNEEVPRLTVYRPWPGRGNGTAVVIAPGGGYIGLAETLEGEEPARWFSARGITAFVLSYRVGEAARLPAVLEDGRRAVRFVRQYAQDFGVNPARVGMLGFSAGGHLAASVTLGIGAGRQPEDIIDTQSARPDFLMLAYPWLEATSIREDGGSAYCDFAAYLEIACQPQDYAQYLPLEYVDGRLPPTFIFHTTNDELVPVAGSLRFFQALAANGVDAELHAFESGPHGVGLGGGSQALGMWPELLEQWLYSHDLIGSAAVAPAARP